MGALDRGRLDSGEKGGIGLILVDIEVPVNGRKYDFRLDENVYIADLIDEIGAMMIPASEGNEAEKIRDMLLCDYEHRRILPLDSTLKQCGIGSGDRLVFL